MIYIRWEKKNIHKQSTAFTVRELNKSKITFENRYDQHLLWQKEMTFSKTVDQAMLTDN